MNAPLTERGIFCRMVSVRIGSDKAVRVSPCKTMGKGILEAEGSRFRAERKS